MNKLIITLIIGLVLILGAAAVAVAINGSSDRPAASDNRTAISDNSVESLASNPNFVEHGFEVKELKDESRIDTATAIQKAKEARGGGQGADITAVKVRLTDKETPQLPNKVKLQDYPVWIVTFHNVTLQMHGPMGTESNTMLADENVVIDANTGEELETFSYSVK